MKYSGILSGYFYFLKFVNLFSPISKYVLHLFSYENDPDNMCFNETKSGKSCLHIPGRTLEPKNGNLDGYIWTQKD